MIDRAHTATDKELARMEKHLAEIYKRANNEIGETWKAYLAEVEKEIKPLQDAYDAAKLSGDKAAIKKAGRELSAKKREKTIMDTHYRNLTKQLAGELSRVNETAVAYINGRLPNVYALNYNATANGVETAVKGYSFELVDASTVKNLATSDKTLLPYKHVDGKKDVRWNTTKVNSEVLQGILQGESIPKIANRLSKVVGMNEASAIRNARTTVTSAENKGRMDMLHEARDKGVEMEKIWRATSDSRTRDSHAALDGESVGIDEEFDNGLMYPGDPDGEPSEVYNCRCTLVYKVIGFGNSKIVSESARESQFVPAETIQDAEQQAANIFNLPKEKVNYDHVNVDVANEINRTANAIIEKYPELNNLAWVQAGNGKEFVAMYNASFTEKWEMVGNALEIGRNAQNVSLQEIQKKIEHLSEIGWTTKGADFSRIIWHEFGHAYASYADGELFKLNNPNYLTDGGAFLRYLRDDKKTFYGSVIKEAKKIAKQEGSKFNVSNISQYATEAKGEMFAEAFAEYNTSSNPTNESRWIMEAVFKLIGAK